MASGSVDDWRVHHEFTVVDEDRPHVDEDKQANISDLLKREDERKYVVRNGLREAVEWVESMRRKWSRHNPLMMRLMQRLIDLWVVQAAVNEVDEEVGKEEKEWELEPLVPCSWALGGGVVEFGVTLKFGGKANSGQQGHEWHSGVGLDHLKLDLVLQEFWVCEGCVVEDEVVGGGGDDEVEEEAEEPRQLLEAVLLRSII